MRPEAIVTLLLGLGMTLPAHALVLDDLLSRGYTIAAATRLPGAWGGCIRQQRLTFADGTVFACANTAGQTAYEPRVYILRLGGGPPSVALIGSAVLAGELLRLKLHDYAVPLRMNPNPMPDHAGADPGSLQPTGAIPSINTITQQRNAPLQRQQSQRPLISHPRY